VLVLVWLRTIFGQSDGGREGGGNAGGVVTLEFGYRG